MKGFADVNWAMLVGSVPRKAGMERGDLLGINGKIFIGQGQAIEKNAAQDVRILVIGNPCNTNCLIAMNNARSIPQDRWFAMTRLDENRAKAQLAQKAGVDVTAVTNLTIWGNHSATQYPDFYNAKINGKSAAEVIGDESWLQGDFIKTVQQRGAAIIKARGLSSAGSAANAGHRQHHLARERHARRRLAQRRRLLRWQLRRAEGLDLLVPDSRQRRQMGDRAGRAGERIQPREDRRIRARARGRARVSRRAIAKELSRRRWGETLSSLGCGDVYLSGSTECSPHRCKAEPGRVGRAT